MESSLPPETVRCCANEAPSATSTAVTVTNAWPAMVNNSAVIIKIVIAPLAINKIQRNHFSTYFCACLTII